VSQAANRRGQNWLEIVKVFYTTKYCLVMPVNNVVNGVEKAIEKNPVAKGDRERSGGYSR
jgi:hypothetical protein